MKHLARLAITAALLCAAAIVFSAEPASACSCVGTQQVVEGALAYGVDAAFVGLVQGPVDGVAPNRGGRSFRFTVESVYSGELGPEVSVEFPVGGSACGYDQGPRLDRVGVLLHREADTWTSNICLVVQPEALGPLGTATDPLPEEPAFRRASDSTAEPAQGPVAAGQKRNSETSRSAGRIVLVGLTAGAVAIAASGMVLHRRIQSRRTDRR